MSVPVRKVPAEMLGLIAVALFGFLLGPAFGDDGASSTPESAPAPNAPPNAAPNVAATPDGTPAADADGYRHLLYLGERRPYVIRLELTFDGVPYRRAWEQLLDERFQALDVNHDGELDREEKEGLKQFRMLPTRAPKQAKSALLQRSPLTGHPKRTDLGLHFKQMGWLPLTVSPANAQGVRAGQRVFQQGPDGLVQAGAILMKHIDTDGDAILTRAEIEQARHALRKMDLDGDEAISRVELVPGASLNAVFGQGVEQAPAELPVAFVDLSENTAVWVASKLLLKYARSNGETGDRQLSRAQIGFPEGLFVHYDGDGNGLLDEDELFSFLNQPVPDAIVVARLGKTAPDAARLELRSTGEQCRTSLQGNGTGLVAFESADLDVTVEPPAATVDLPMRLEQMIVTADRDKNGYVDRNEAGQLGTLSQRFGELDVDGDGQLFPKEFVQVMLPSAQVASRQLRVGIGEAAVDMFLAIDRDQDARITTREFRALPALIATWDNNGNGGLDADEVPRRYRLQLGIEEFLPRVGPQTRVAVEQRVLRPVTAPGPSAVPSPAWFLRMDRNGDGDVSRREFLGTRDDFNKLDLDHDELISGTEAASVSP